MKNNFSENHSIILLRGLPGSGKSTLANVLSEHGKYPVLSVDDYFTNEAGEYNFEFDKNHLAYKQCEQQAKKFMEEEVEKLFIANTFTLDWEMEPYFAMANKFDYRLFVVTVEKYHDEKNIHGTSDEQLLKMGEKYKVKLI